MRKSELFYNVKLSKEAERDYEKHIEAGKFSLVEKIDQLLDELSIDPRRNEIGKPERLKHYEIPKKYQLKHIKQEVWSRRIDKKHRMVYVIEDKIIRVFVISLYSHYGEK